MARLQLDLDLLKQNGQRMADEIRSLGKHWRPHVKAHSQPKIAQIMVDLGAIGVTAATVAEVEVMANAGIPSALLAHLATEDSELDRLAAASKKLQLNVCADHFVHVERLAAAAARNDTEFNVIVDIDIGMGRTGTRPRIDALTLAKAADQLDRINVAGIMGYEGHLLTIPDPEQKRDQIFEAMNLLGQSRDAILNEGLLCDIVSAGGSGSFWITGQHEAPTELQCGGGAFGDLFYQRTCGLTGVTSALTVVAHVVSRPSLTRAVINCGRKAINPVVYQPEVAGVDGTTVESLSAEHIVLALDGPARDLAIGDEVRLALGYSDHSILMHREIEIFEGGLQVDTWPVIRNQ